MDNAKLIYNGQEYELPVVVGTENEAGIDVSKLRGQTGAITLDPGYSNTGSCLSAITYLDGENGILRYRGYPIEQLAEYATFTEVAWLLIYGELPNKAQLADWRRQLSKHSFIHEDMLKFFEGFPITAHPMAILASMVCALSAYYPENTEEDLQTNIARVMAKAKTIAAFSYKKSVGEPVIYPISGYTYAANLLRMMFATPSEPYEVPKVLEDALRMLLILHADHEQNCSTSTVRMVGSSQASLYASMAAGVTALWGPRHGGANQAVIEMLEQIRAEGGNYKKFLERVKNKESGVRLMGFGHRVYRYFDPRAKLIKAQADKVLNHLGFEDPLLDIAKNLEEEALADDYFVERKLYPNVDFYSGIIYRAMGVPLNMYTVMFALGRLPGWMAHWKEMRDDPQNRIYRPRQIYTGPVKRDFIPLEQRP
ncbi:MAG: citrate synthase [Candidatus Hydrogenedentota bacterium]